MIENENSIITTISNTINSLISSLLSSIDNNIYSILDSIVFIDEKILNDNFISSFFGTSTTTGLLMLSNSLLVGFAIFYIIRYAYSHYSSTQTEQPFQFIFKLFIFAILSNYSYFICEQFLHINSLISLSIQEIGESIFNCKINFSELILKLNNILTIDSPNINFFSIDGILKSFISINLLNLLFTYSLRYVILKVFILITPFAIITLINSSTAWFFKAWFKSVLSLLLLQSFVSLILLVIFSTNFSSTNLFSKIICIGSIYALSKASSYIRELIGGISTEVSNNINSLRYLLK
ncbi:MAG: hypothetical protein E7313_05485 [Clostridiales bacterium]|nr:hypothetical protein [Clostridiales bacterium]